jgi:hypothetical protein
LLIEGKTDSSIPFSSETLGVGVVGPDAGMQNGEKSSVMKAKTVDTKQNQITALLGDRAALKSACELCKGCLSSSAAWLLLNSLRTSLV